MSSFTLELALEFIHASLKYLDVVASCEKKQHQDQRSNHSSSLNTQNCSSKKLSCPLIKARKIIQSQTLPKMTRICFTYLACNSYQNYSKQCQEEAGNCSFEASHEVYNNHEHCRIENMCHHVTQSAADIIYT